MDTWDKMVREERYRTKTENPSFSSSLLDAIYRSIDESNGGGKRNEDLIFCRETSSMRKKQSNNSSSSSSFQRACMIEKWMEKKENKVFVTPKSLADFDDSVLLNSSSTSSDSSYGGGFSSSESDSFYSAKSRSSSSYHCHRLPKPIRTSTISAPKHEVFQNNFHGATQKSKHEGSFIKTKSKALKIYSDLKKVKQPISPGGRLASFLNSLFTSGNAKKTKISSSKTEQATSTCSSASSFSRSCLSTTKTPSSRGNVGTKRSVRFCLDEDSRTCGETKILHENELRTSMRKPVNKELEYRFKEENRRVAEAAKELYNSYQKKKIKEELYMRGIIYNGNEVLSDDETSAAAAAAIADDDDDDIASDASSDLFELDNLSAIGSNERYSEELPVYETTHLDTNRAIANGLIL
ncbi:hypothetical protein Gohar_026170 [Gossypium harknessii]|uniref:Protein BIG GRAIN 1-like B n=1 Tax=Gossypium harknessii TaxID=34285 RepID=A0A7J9HQP1_9ROSI|nr:hypothetical protein [Gossypium harknessii]